MRKIKLILICMITAIALSSCGDLPGNETGNSSSTTSRNIQVALKSNVETAISRTAVTEGDDLAMWFRSSDIEFWSTALAGGYTELVSDLYSSVADDPDKISVSINLPDIPETFKFVQGTVHEVQDDSANFVNTIYDIIRIDIGGGGFGFEHNGVDVSPVNIITGETNGINGNSLFLISDTLLDDSYYVPRSEFYDSKEELLASGCSEFLADFISASSRNGGENNIDMDGALFIPFSGIDLTSDISTLSIFLEWDIIGAFDDADNDGTYEMDDRYNGTCFDFNVRVETE